MIVTGLLAIVLRAAIGATAAAGLMAATSTLILANQNTLILANQKEIRMQDHPYVGMWVTADGHVRQELLSNGRYDEARGNRRSAYQGRYEISGNRINYWDDTGFTADGVFVGQDELHHGGMVFFRRK